MQDAAVTGRYRILPHARQRCDERDVSAADIEHAVAQGHRVRARDRFEQAWSAWSYCFEGKTLDDGRLPFTIRPAYPIEWCSARFEKRVITASGCGLWPMRTSPTAMCMSCRLASSPAMLSA